MWKRLSREHLINVEVISSMVLISMWRFLMWVWWWWHLGLEGNWLPMVPCVSAMGKALLINSVGFLAMVAISGFHETYFWELSFISMVSLLISIFLGRTHLLKNGLLGPLFLARAQVHPLTIALHDLYLINAEVEIVAKGMWSWVIINRHWWDVAQLFNKCFRYAWISCSLMSDTCIHEWPDRGLGNWGGTGNWGPFPAPSPSI